MKTLKIKNDSIENHLTTQYSGSLIVWIWCSHIRFLVDKVLNHSSYGPSAEGLLQCFPFLLGEERVNVLRREGQGESAGEGLPEARGVGRVGSVVVAGQVMEEGVAGLSLGVTDAAVGLT